MDLIIDRTERRSEVRGARLLSSRNDAMVEIISNRNGIPVGAMVQGHHGLYFFHSYIDPALGVGWCGIYQELRRRIDDELATRD